MERKELVKWIQENSVKILLLIGVGIIVVFGTHSCKESFKQEQKASSKEDANHEFSKISTLWAKPPNIAAGTDEIVVTYHNDKWLVFYENGETEDLTEIKGFNRSLTYGKKSSGTVDYSIELDKKAGTWSQKYIEEGGTLVVTSISDNEIYIDQFHHGELLKKLVISK